MRSNTLILKKIRLKGKSYNPLLQFHCSCECSCGNNGRDGIAVRGYSVYPG